VIGEELKYQDIQLINVDGFLIIKKEENYFVAKRLELVDQKNVEL